MQIIQAISHCRKWLQKRWYWFSTNYAVKQISKQLSTIIFCDVSSENFKGRTSNKKLNLNSTLISQLPGPERARRWPINFLPKSYIDWHLEGIGPTGQDTYGRALALYRGRKSRTPWRRGEYRGVLYKRKVLGPEPREKMHEGIWLHSTERQHYKWGCWTYIPEIWWKRALTTKKRKERTKRIRYFSIQSTTRFKALLRSKPVSSMARHGSPRPDYCD